MKKKSGTPVVPKKTFSQLLNDFNACANAKFWAEDKTIEEIVTHCHRGDWLLWLAEKIQLDKIELTRLKGHCANTIRHLMKDERSVNAVDAAINFNGDIESLNKHYEQASDAKFEAECDISIAYLKSDAHANHSKIYDSSALVAKLVCLHKFDSDSVAINVAETAFTDAFAYYSNSDDYKNRLENAIIARNQSLLLTADIVRIRIASLIIDKVNELLNK